MTPALNASRFIGATLESVRGQTYTDIEHIVVDGGSSDGTQSLVRDSGSARLVEAPGLRQAAAVNRGVRESYGSSIVVLNADDVLFPDAIGVLAAALDLHADAAAVYGDAVHIDERGGVIAPYPTQPFDRERLAESCYICQAAAAVRRRAYDAVGGMDEKLDYALDYDFWVRLAVTAPLVKVDGVLAGSRMHPNAKSLARRDAVFAEVIPMLRARFGYVPYTWSFAYTAWLLDGTDQFFEPPRWPKIAVPLSLIVGAALNRRNILRYIRDWYGHRAIGRKR